MAQRGLSTRPVWAVFFFCLIEKINTKQHLISAAWISEQLSYICGHKQTASVSEKINWCHVSGVWWISCTHTHSWEQGIVAGVVFEVGVWTGNESAKFKWLSRGVSDMFLNSLSTDMVWECCCCCCGLNLHLLNWLVLGLICICTLDVKFACFIKLASITHCYNFNLHCPGTTEYNVCIVLCHCQNTIFPVHSNFTVTAIYK